MIFFHDMEAFELKSVNSKLDIIVVNSLWINNTLLQK